MTAFYEDERCTLYGGEALAVLADLPDGSVDAVITDPPYSSGGQFRGDRSKSSAKKYGAADRFVEFSGDNRDARSFAYWCGLWLSEALRSSKPGAICGLFTDWRQLPAVTDAVQSGGWVWRGIIPWYKPNTRRFGGRITAQCEYIVWGSNGALPNPMDGGECFPGFYTADAPRDREHQTQKPLQVMREITRVVPPDGAILDPFMGSGTTGVAAMIEGRRFIGCEKVDHFQQVARRRICEAQGQAVDRDDGQMALVPS